MHLAGQLGDQPRPAAPLRAADQDQRAAAGSRALPGRAQPLQLGVTADQRRAAFQAPAAARPPPVRQSDVLAQDRLVQRAQLRSGLDADLLDERAPRPPVGLERFGLAPDRYSASISCPCNRSLQRMLGDERLELADQLAVRAGGEVGVDRPLERGQPQLLQPPDLGRGERLVRDVGQRRAAPQRQRLARGALCHQPLEPARVDLAPARSAARSRARA